MSHPLQILGLVEIVVFVCVSLHLDPSGPSSFDGSVTGQRDSLALTVGAWLPLGLAPGFCLSFLDVKTQSGWVMNRG